MAKCAIISDIHGNLAAFKAVLAHIDAQKDISEIWCLGDVIGYGPEPVECYKIARERCSIIIKGNHERAVTEPVCSEKFTPIAKAAIEWTGRTLRAAPDAASILADLGGLGTSFDRDGMRFVHGSPLDPTNEYLMPGDVLKPHKINPQFGAFDTYCFIGHTHHPGVFEKDGNTVAFRRPEEMMKGIYFLDNEYQAIINVGSVGQPRDRNPQACYVTFMGDSVRYHRVPYNINETRRKIYAIPDLSDKLGDRLVEGK